MPDFTITVRPGHPDFLDLDWTRSLADWDSPRIIDLPRGISRHVVRFVSYHQGIYAVKELPTFPAHRDYEVLRDLETVGAAGGDAGRSHRPTKPRSHRRSLRLL